MRKPGKQLDSSTRLAQGQASGGKVWDEESTVTYVLAEHVETIVLEHLDVVLHSLSIGRGVKPIRPVSLIKRAEPEDELAVEKLSGDTIDISLGDGAESSIAEDLIIAAQSDSQVVESGGLWPPGLYVVDGELELLTRGTGA